MAAYHDTCVHMGSKGAYLTDPIGKCQRHIRAFSGNGKSRIDRYLVESDTYKAAEACQDLQSKFSSHRAQEGILEWLESRSGGDRSRFPILVDEKAGIVKQPKKECYGLLSDVKACLYKETVNGTLIPWDQAKCLLNSQLARHTQEAIIAADSDQSTFGTKLASSHRRIGQDKWRKRVEALWNGRCVVTGCSNPQLLKGSHIKRHEKCSTTERLDAYNGLFLAAHIDAAFEVGLISFSDTGKMLISPEFAAADRAAIGLPASAKLPHLPERTRSYLTWHREHRFKS